MRSIVFVLVAGFGLAACEQQEKSAMTEQKEHEMEADKKAYEDVPDKARQALVIADQVDKNPGQLDAALKAEGMDREDFDDLMYDVAKDPKLSDAFIARREAGPGEQHPKVQ